LEKWNWESQVNVVERVFLDKFAFTSLLYYFIRYHLGGGGEPGINVKYYNLRKSNFKFSGKWLSKSFIRPSPLPLEQWNLKGRRTQAS